MKITCTQYGFVDTSGEPRVLAYTSTKYLELSRESPLAHVAKNSSQFQCGSPTIAYNFEFWNIQRSTRVLSSFAFDIHGSIATHQKTSKQLFKEDSLSCGGYGQSHTYVDNELG